MNNIPEDRIRIFNREGIALAEFQAAVDRSWCIGDEGRAGISLPTRKTEIVNERVLNFGNWLLVENTVLPPWVGVIDTPREWHARNVTICAYTPEHVFGWRRGPLEEVLTGSAGTIFEKILGFVNAPEATIIRAGSIWTGGSQRQETINPTKLSEDLKRIYERSGEEYQWRPVIGADGRLVVYADWKGTIGTATSIILQEGGNVEAVNNTLVEDGDIVNDLLAYGDGETWESKPNAEVIDQTSRGKYGLRQSSEEYSGVTDKTTLQANGKELVNGAKDPLNSYQVNALNVGATFQYMQLGNRVNLRMQNAGFLSNGLGLNKTVRITAMSYDTDMRGKISLVVNDVA